MLYERFLSLVDKFLLFVFEILRIIIDLIRRTYRASPGWTIIRFAIVLGTLVFCIVCYSWPLPYILGILFTIYPKFGDEYSWVFLIPSFVFGLYILVLFLWMLIKVTQKRSAELGTFWWVVVFACGQQYCSVLLAFAPQLDYYDILPPEAFIGHSFIVRSASIFYLRAAMFTLGLTFLFLYACITKKKFVQPEWVFLYAVLMGAIDLLLQINEFFSFFLILECVAFILYVLIMRTGGTAAKEAALKYFILNSLISALMVFSLACIWLDAGSLSIPRLLAYTNGMGSPVLLFTTGVLLFISSFAAKLAIGPFYQWSIDVYEGSSYLLLVVQLVMLKIVFIFLLARFVFLFSMSFSVLQDFFFLGAVISLVVGALGALAQRRIKRFMAFNALHHTGFIIAGFCALNVDPLSALQSIFFYLFTSSLALLGLLTYFMYIEWFTAAPLVYISDMLKIPRCSKAAVVLVVFSLLSSSGLPPFIGFWGKLSIFAEVYSTHSFILLGVMVGTSVISSYYYLRLAKEFFLKAIVLYPISFFNFQRRQFTMLIGAGTFELISVVLIIITVICSFYPQLVYGRCEGFANDLMECVRIPQYYIFKRSRW